MFCPSHRQRQGGMRSEATTSWGKARRVRGCAAACVKRRRWHQSGGRCVGASNGEVIKGGEKWRLVGKLSKVAVLTAEAYRGKCWRRWACPASAAMSEMSTARMTMKLMAAKKSSCIVCMHGGIRKSRRLARQRRGSGRSRRPDGSMALLAQRSKCSESAAAGWALAGKSHVGSGGLESAARAAAGDRVMWHPSAPLHS